MCLWSEVWGSAHSRCRCSRRWRRAAGRGTRRAGRGDADTPPTPPAGPPANRVPAPPRGPANRVPARPRGPPETMPNPRASEPRPRTLSPPSNPAGGAAPFILPGGGVQTFPRAPAARASRPNQRPAIEKPRSSFLTPLLFSGSGGGYFNQTATFCLEENRRKDY